jgi:FlaA1/EpsC-like NDP-sugar epimerase
MGEPVKIVDLARDLIRLSGLREGEDIEIQFTGMRPGEKLFEEIATDSEQADSTSHPKIFVGRVRRPELEVVNQWIPEIRELTSTSDGTQALSFLRRNVPEMIRPDVATEPETLTQSGESPLGEQRPANGASTSTSAVRTARPRLDTGGHLAAK